MDTIIVTVAGPNGSTRIQARQGAAVGDVLQLAGYAYDSGRHSLTVDGQAATLATQPGGNAIIALTPKKANGA